MIKQQNNKIAKINKWIINNYADNEVTSKFTSQVQSRLIQTSKMKLFEEKINGWNMVTIIAKSFTPNVWQSSEYLSGLCISLRIVL